MVSYFPSPGFREQSRTAARIYKQMPFCSNCGKQAHDRDIYCANCGAPQPVRPAQVIDPMAGITPRTASVLCYIPVIGWIAAVIVLAAQRFRQNRVVRFHAFQGLYLFAAWIFVDWVVHPFFRALPDHVVRVDLMLQALILGLWIFMIVKASREEAYVLPIIGELAQRSAAEH